MDFVIFSCLFFSLAGWWVFGFSNDAKYIKTTNTLNNKKICLKKKKRFRLID
jgi:hypothetical protein